jgi:transposase
MALVYENARQKGNANCATLAVARTLVAYLMVVDREQRDFEPVRGLAGIAA